VKKYIAFFASTLALAFAITAAAAALAPKFGETRASLDDAVEAFAEYDAKSYIVRDDGGRIAVYSPNFREKPAITTEIVTANLPSHDRAELLRGISVETYEEVLELLQDFSN